MRFSDRILNEIAEGEFTQGDNFMDGGTFLVDNKTKREFTFQSGESWNINRRRKLFGGYVYTLSVGENEIDISDYDQMILHEAWVLAHEILAEQEKAKEQEKLYIRENAGVDISMTLSGKIDALPDPVPPPSKVKRRVKKAYNDIYQIFYNEMQVNKYYNTVKNYYETI